MISTWDDALQELEDRIVAGIEEHENGLTNWYGKVWVVHITERVMGTNTFLILPTGSDETTDRIMVIACEERSGEWIRTGKLFETDRVAVPYDEVLEQFKEEISSRLQ